MSDNEHGFWRQLLGETAGAFGRMVATTLALGLVGALIGAVAGFVMGGAIGALVGAVIGAAVLGGGWIAINSWIFD